eukprot:365043-Chlamydomonas_euryale.AAC.4
MAPYPSDSLPQPPPPPPQPPAPHLQRPCRPAHPLRGRLRLGRICAAPSTPWWLRSCWPSWSPAACTWTPRQRWA